MHELAVTEEIVKIALEYAERNNAQKVIRINLRIGEMSHLVEDMLIRVFHHLTRGTIMEGAKVFIERSAIILRCGDCDMSYTAEIQEIVNSACPVCGGTNFTIVSGREFYIDTIEVI